MTFHRETLRGFHLPDDAWRDTCQGLLTLSRGPLQKCQYGILMEGRKEP